MPRRGLTFRVFVSSTFADMAAERNILQEKTFPRLRQYCRERGANFQAIDVRWGVSDEASLDQQTMNICLGEIRRCQQITPRPNFLVLLGQRYGWKPPPPQVPADVFERILKTVSDEERDLLQEWYRRDNNVARRIDDAEGLQSALARRGTVLFARGKYAEAFRLFQEQEGICRRLGLPGFLGLSLVNQASLLFAHLDRPGDALMVGQPEVLLHGLIEHQSLSFAVFGQQADPVADGLAGMDVAATKGVEDIETIVKVPFIDTLRVDLYERAVSVEPTSGLRRNARCALWFSRTASTAWQIGFVAEARKDASQTTLVTSKSARLAILS